MTRTLAPLPRWGFGAAPIGAFTESESDRVANTVDRALAHGMTLIDTSPFYGRSEALLGAALTGVPRSSYVLSTKVGNDSDGTQAGATLVLEPDAIKRSVERSLQRLRTDHLDVLHLHEPGVPDPRAALEGRIDEVFAVLSDLKAQGITDRIGVGLNRVDLAIQLLGEVELDCLLLASRFTLLEQAGRAVVRACHRRGVSFLAAGIYNSGILATGPTHEATYEYSVASPAVVERVIALEKVCLSWGVPLRVAASHFPGRDPLVNTVIVGARSGSEIDEFFAAVDTPIPAGLWSDIAELQSGWAG